MKMQKNPAYEPPKSGSHVATITRITDIGIQKTSFGEKPQVRVRFEVEEKDSRGQKKFFTRTFTNSLHKKSNFVKFFSEIGHPITGDDVETDSLLGTTFAITVKQVKVDGKPRARVDTVAPLAAKTGVV